MPNAFRVKTQTKDGALVVQVIGDLDWSSASELALILAKAVDQSEQILIDTTRVRHLHPFGRAVLDNALKRLRRSGSELLLTDSALLQ